MSTSEQDVGEPAAGNPNFPRLDALRAIAAVLVLAYHWVGVAGTDSPMYELPAHGDIGVVIFFILSGFLIYRPFVAARNGLTPPVRWRKFYAKRGARIIPAYWVALTGAHLLFGLPAFSQHWLQLYAFGQIYSPNLVFSGGLGPAWSLCVEVSFYLVLPVYSTMISRGVRTRSMLLELCVLAALAAASMIAHRAIASQASIANLSFTLVGTFYLFAIGMALAVLSVNTRVLEAASRYSLSLWCCALTLFVIVSYSIDAAQLGSVNPIYAPIAVLILLPALARNACGFVATVLSPKALSWVGVVSYSFYLWHQIVLQQLSLHIGNPVALLLIAFLASLGIATVSYYGVERPFLRLTRRRLSAHARR